MRVSAFSLSAVVALLALAFAPSAKADLVTETVYGLRLELQDLSVSANFESGSGNYLYFDGNGWASQATASSFSLDDVTDTEYTVSAEAEVSAFTYDPFSGFWSPDVSRADAQFRSYLWAEALFSSTLPAGTFPPYAILDATMGVSLTLSTEQYQADFDTNDPNGEFAESLAFPGLFKNEVVDYQHDTIAYSFDLSGFDDPLADWTLTIYNANSGAIVEEVTSADATPTGDGELPALDATTGESINYEISLYQTLFLDTGENGYLGPINIESLDGFFNAELVTSTVPEASQFLQAAALLAVAGIVKRGRRMRK